MSSYVWIPVLAISIFLAILTGASYLRWKKTTLTRLRNGAQIIATACGPVECAIVGEGPTVLILHGALGGYDQSLAAIASGFFTGRSYRFIAISRPGYLRTPPEVGETPEQQADACAALLDALKVQKAIVAGISAGGPPSVQFAVRHPDRCAALVLVSAVTERVEKTGPKDANPLLRALLRADFLAWLALGLARRFPKLCFWPVLTSKELRHLGDPRVHANMLRIMASITPLTARWRGLMIDGTYLTTLSPLPLYSIRVPTLLLHGINDTVVPFASSQRAAAAIPRARLVPIENGSHLACILGLRDLGPEVSEIFE